MQRSKSALLNSCVAQRWYFTRLALRILLAAAAAVAAFYFTFWIARALIFRNSDSAYSAVLSAAMIGIIAGYLAWISSRPGNRSLLASVVFGAIATGTVSFLVGFFGPGLLSDANQGPLLGLFFTGPIGFILGAVGGAITWFVRRHREHLRRDGVAPVTG